MATKDKILTAKFDVPVAKEPYVRPFVCNGHLEERSTVVVVGNTQAEFSRTLS